jgi:putative ABC transport system substrate-binding protein
MKRREFITLLGGAAIACPLGARGQQAGKLPIIGFLGANPSIESQRVAAFVQRLRELGWIEGRTVSIEYRWAEGRSERYAENAAELVRLKVDVIVASTTPPSLAAKQATAIFPIVFAAATDPIGTGGNPGSMLDMSEAEATARRLGLEVTTSEIRRAEDIAPAFEAFRNRVDALYLCPDPLMNTNRTRINILAVGARLPTMHGHREYVEAGALMSYGPNLASQFQRAADRRQDSTRR